MPRLYGTREARAARFLPVRPRGEFLRVFDFSPAQPGRAQFRRPRGEQLQRRGRAPAIQCLHTTKDGCGGFARQLLVHNAAQHEPEMRVVARTLPFARTNFGDQRSERRIHSLEMRDRAPRNRNSGRHHQYE